MLKWVKRYFFFVVEENSSYLSIKQQYYFGEYSGQDVAQSSGQVMSRCGISCASLAGNKKRELCVRSQE